MKKIILISAIFVLFSTLLVAQKVNTATGLDKTTTISTKPNLDVNGLEPRTKYTDAQMRATLGEPTKFNSWDDEMGGGRTYHFNTKGDKYDYFHYQEADGITMFNLATPTFSVFDGRLKVGDNISKLRALGGLLKPDDKEQNVYRFYPAGFVTDAYLRITVDNNDVIKFIGFIPPV